MAAVGLVPELTLKAAQMAALGAGAKVMCAYGFEIDDEIIREIENKHCDIVLLCGGTDGGNKKAIVHNAQIIADSNIACPILACGNRSAASEVQRILEAGGKQVYTAKNVLPAIDRVDAGPAQALIREIFISHIIEAKGLDKAKELFNNSIMPTPKAALMAASLLADGTKNESGIGSLLVVEVGGATINVHSVENVKPVTKETIIRGLPEARITRTVEGDMGIRYNARTIFDTVGAKSLSEQVAALAQSRASGLSREVQTEPLPEPTAAATPKMTSQPADVLSPESINADTYTQLLSAHPSHEPENETEALIDIALAKSSVDIAVGRHAGYTKTEMTPIGEVTVQYGKNLLEVKNVLGTGGIFKYGIQPEAVLESALLNPASPWSLRPRGPTAYIDVDYSLYAMGLLSQEFPDEALRILKKSIKKIDR